MRIAYGILSLCIVSGCVEQGKGMDNVIPLGTSITEVQYEYGIPDLIIDRSGDLSRFYAPTSRPVEEWPWESRRSFVYLDRKLLVAFVNGRAIDVHPLSADELTTYRRWQSKVKTP